MPSPLRPTLPTQYTESINIILRIGGIAIIVGNLAYFQGDGEQSRAARPRRSFSLTHGSAGRERLTTLPIATPPPRPTHIAISRSTLRYRDDFVLPHVHFRAAESRDDPPM